MYNNNNKSSKSSNKQAIGATEMRVLFFKKKPHESHFSNLQNVAKNLIKANPVEDPERFLWEYNCAFYATVITYKNGAKE